MSRTIHVTVPDSVYDELREYASEMGLAVSGLVRLFIKEGLERLRRKRRRLRLLGQLGESVAADGEAEEAAAEVPDVLVEVLARLEKLQQMVEERLTAIEGDLYRMRIQLNNLRRRVSRLEDVVEDKVMPVEVDAGDLLEASQAQA